jgi:hypothetical protein
MKQLINEIKRMQQLAGVVNESKLNEKIPSELTREETLNLERKLEEFLNSAIFSSNIVEKEEKAIEYIIKSLTDRISYYPDSV